MIGSMYPDEELAPGTPASQGTAARLARKGLPVLAGTVGGLLIWFAVSDYVMSAIYLALAEDQVQAFADVWVGTAFVLWWAFIVLSCILPVLVVVCWRAAPTLDLHPLQQIVAGLLLTWAWRLGIRALEDWGLRVIAPENQATPELIMFNTISVLANQAIDLVAAGLLIAGAARLRRRVTTRASVGGPEPRRPG
jgi:hypothetical protein